MGWITKNLTTHTPGTPLGTYQPTAWLFAQFTRHVVFQGFSSNTGGDGQLYELYCSASDDWHVKNLVSEAGGADAATTSNGYIYATQGSQHVVYQGSRFDGHVHELYYNEGDGWQSNDLTVSGHAPTLTLSQPFGFETHFDGTQRVAYQGRDRHIHVLSNGGNGWHDQDLSALPGAPLCAADAAPTGYSFENQHTAHVLVRSDNNHILEYWMDASGWHWGDLTVAAGAPLAADGDVHGYVFIGQGTQHVDYVGQDGHIHELWWSPSGWRHNDLTVSGGGAAAALGSAPACYAFEGQLFQPSPTQHVFFLGTDSFIHEMWWDASGWHYNAITSAALGSAAAISDAVAFVEVDNATQNVFYLSDAHQIIELRWKP